MSGSISADTILACDLAVLRAPLDRDGWLAPSEVGLVVEIADATRDRDLGTKRHRYASAGIPTYWVIDVLRCVIHVFDRPEGGDYMGIAIVKFGEPLAVPGTEATIVLD